MNSGSVGLGARIVGAWRSGTLLEPMTDVEKPESIAAAYAVQKAMVERMARPVVGWKLGCTSLDSQRFLSAEEPIFGRILEADIRQSEAVIDHARHDMLIVEGEFVFVMGRDLPPRERPYTSNDVIGAIDAVHPAIELVQSRHRIERMPVRKMIAHNAYFGRLILGVPVANWRSLNPANLAVQLDVNREPVAAEHGRDVLGNPLNAVVWLANALGQQGLTLAARHRVITGTCTGVVRLNPGDRVQVRFGEHAEVRAEFC